jgi:aspartate kinase
LKSLAVAKFGGSLIDFSGTKISAIVKCLSNMKATKDMGPLAVFSAPRGVTDKLQAIGEAKAAGRNYDLDSIFTPFSKLSARYVKEALLKEFRSTLQECRNDVEEALLKVNKRFDSSARAKVLTSGGELPTSMLMSYVLRSHGVKSCYLRKADWPLVIDDDFENATLDFERSLIRLQQLLHYLDEGNVVSVAGFLGITHDGLETLLGRGGSDQTAVFLSCLLRDYYDLETVLLKDTPVQSVDPAIVKDQTLKNIPVMTYNEASKATISGMTIIQNAAVRLAMSQRLRIKVAPLKDMSLGTAIQAEDPTSYTVKCITGLRDCAIVTMNNDRSRSFEDCLRLWEGYEGFLDLGAEVMETGQVIRDFLILDANFVRRHEEQLKSLDKEMKVEYGLGIVALIGDKMRNSPGVASISIGAIPDINIKRGVFAPHTSQIILVLNEQDVPETIRRIHTQLNKVNKT